MPSATVTRGLTFPAGATTRSPSSSWTRETNRPRTTDASDGAWGAAASFGVVVQAPRSAALTTSTPVRHKLGTGRTGHSLPAARR